MGKGATTAARRRPRRAASAPSRRWRAPVGGGGRRDATSADRRVARSCGCRGALPANGERATVAAGVRRARPGARRRKCARGPSPFARRLAGGPREGAVGLPLAHFHVGSGGSHHHQPTPTGYAAIGGASTRQRAFPIGCSGRACQKTRAPLPLTIVTIGCVYICNTHSTSWICTFVLQ